MFIYIATTPENFRTDRMDGWMTSILRPFQQDVDNKRLCAMETPFTVDQISPRAVIQLGPLDQ